MIQRIKVLRVTVSTSSFTPKRRRAGYAGNELTPELIAQKLKTLHHSDSAPFGSLLNPAYKRAAIACGRPDHTKLSFQEKLFAWFAGCLPR